MVEDTTLRDELARDRTALANERTLLAYGRTSLGLVALSVFVFRFAPTSVGITIGICALIIGLGVLLLGVRNYRLVASRIATDVPQSRNQPMLPLDLDD